MLSNSRKTSEQILMTPSVVAAFFVSVKIDGSFAALVEIPHSVGLRKVDPPAQQGRGRHGDTPHPGGHHHRHHHRPLHALGQTVLGNQGYIRLSSVVFIKY